MAITVQSILDAVILGLNDPTLDTAAMGAGNQFTPNELLGYLAEAVPVIAKRTGAWRDRGTISVTAGTAVYSLPAGALDILLMTIDSDVVYPRTSDWVYRTYDDADSETGQPVYRLTDAVAEGQVELWPTPDAAYTAKVRYTKTPAIPAALGDSVDAPERYKLAFVHFVLARAYAKDGELQSQEREASHLEAFDNIVTAWEADVRGRVDQGIVVPKMRYE
jgi:hypothetical protein